MKGFEEGYAHFAENSSALYSAGMGEEYVNCVKTETYRLLTDLQELGKYKTNIAQLKGDVAEFWHADTHNINAALNGSKNRAFVDRSHDFASADITTNYGDRFGLKYYKSASESAKEQSVTFYQRFKEYKGPLDFEEYLRERGYTELEGILHKPIYEGQKRLIPSDQFEDAVKWLTEKIAKEKEIRPEQVHRYKETLRLLCDRIIDDEGITSEPLTKARAEELAEWAKEGSIDAGKLHMTPDELITYDYIMSQAFKAGLTSATISVVLKLAPELLKTIEYLIQNGTIDKEHFKTMGFAALEGSLQGFLCGSISSALTITCCAGKLGIAAESIHPSVIGAVTAIVYNTMINSFRVATGKMTARELTDELVRQMFVSGCSLIGAGLTQSVIEIPVLGFMLGNFIGSVVGSFAYDLGYSAVLSFCVDTGFTM